MTKKSLGYVKLEWTCPNCQTRNPGPNAFCNGCGAPQPENVTFEQPPEESFITDKAELARAKAGPDKHCPYCGARNRGDAAFCGGCGGDLKDAEKRASGQVLGAHRDKPAPPITCPNCGQDNPPDAKTCASCGASLTLEKPASPKRSPRKIGGLAAILLIIACLATVLGFMFLGGRRDTLEGSVSQVYWERSIPIEMRTLTSASAFLEDIPPGADIGNCTLEVHHTQDSPAANSQEVCGTPYTVDTGSGYGEVVQDCIYEVYQDYCDYQAYAWTVVDVVTDSGYDLSPSWPLVQAGGERRQGEREETFRVTFSTPDGSLDYSPPSEQAFQQFEPGSTWSLEVNAFDRVISAEPLR